MPWVRRTPVSSYIFFFFNDTATTEIYTLSLHDALPICQDFVAALDDQLVLPVPEPVAGMVCLRGRLLENRVGDRKSTRLNSSHGYISYAVFCLKKKKKRRKKSYIQKNSRNRCDR